MFIRTACAVAILAAAALPAHAADYTIAATLSQSSPMYVAPGSAGPVPYKAFTFTVSADGLYTLGLGTSGGYFPYLALYSPSFDPTAPGDRLLQSVAHAPSSFSVSFKRTLSANTTYIAVLAGDLFAPAGGTNPPQYAGQGYISGPGTVTPGAAPGPVSEPASWAAMIAGFALLGATLRRRRVTVRYA